ncbi:MAG TPA: nitroreductase family deazaflavin-dependent oxidoreductase [Candidatus Binatus sp.]|nr:nitroreductase family deazaflavin-dependent oxidoreductase [Candidatus Binatus sp.]
MSQPLSQVPAFVRLTNPFANALLRVGLPMGPNSLVTIRGRTSGQPRSMPLAVLELDDRRWIIGAYGDVNWTRNLRAAGEAEIQVHGAMRHVTARELRGDAAVGFFRNILPAYIRRFPAAGRVFASIFFRLVAPEITRDPERAATTHPVFELEAS